MNKNHRSSARPHNNGRIPRRRERERLVRKSDILHAARTVFARRGYRDATVEEIARCADYAKGTVYNYFASKHELFHEVVNAMQEEMEVIAAGAVRAGIAPDDTFRRYAEQTVEYFKANTELLLLVVHEMHRSALEGARGHMAAFSRHIGRVAGHLSQVLRRRSGANVSEAPELLAQIFVSLVHTRCMRHYFQGKNIRDLDSKAEAEFLTRFFFHGVRA